MMMMDAIFRDATGEWNNGVNTPGLGLVETILTDKTPTVVSPYPWKPFLLGLLSFLFDDD